jgi:hypothetical protein
VRGCGCRPRGCLSGTWTPGQIAGLLRVSTKSVYQWRRAWRAGGRQPWRRGGRAGTPASWMRTSCPAARRAGRRPGRLRLARGPAVDPGPGRGADQAAVPRRLHAARGVVPTAPRRVHPAGGRAPAAERDEGKIAAWWAITAGTTCLWSSGPVISVRAAAVILAVVFVAVGRRAAGPARPPHQFGPL